MQMLMPIPMPMPRDTHFTVNTQRTKEKGAKEAKETGKRHRSQAPAGTVALQATGAMTALRQVAVHTEAKEAKVGKVEKVPPWQ